MTSHEAERRKDAGIHEAALLADGIFPDGMRMVGIYTRLQLNSFHSVMTQSLSIDMTSIDTSLTTRV